jgi:leucyl-tRNA synthetase
MSRRDYNFSEFEPKWRKHWEESGLHKCDLRSNKPKYYCLDMFPYPSGSALHVGHWEPYVMSDLWSRYKKMRGFEVLHPTGWDAFGLPTEQDAVKKGLHPKVNTAKNVTNMKRQMMEIGAMYDWSRAVNTTDPRYYKWTQWIFLQMYKKGLAYRQHMSMNWCPNCTIVLANEEVVAGCCERCGTVAGKKDVMQWLLRITKYADRLLYDLDKLEWDEKVKTQQRNWIGRSEGAGVTFKLFSHDGKKSFDLMVFTTRPDTLFGATYMVLAPEHPLVAEIAAPGKKPELEKYVAWARMEKEIDRTAAVEKTGVDTGGYAINPVNNGKIPVWISDYVLMSYGTGAIMAVPAHDERDFAFAKKYNLPIIEVVSNPAAKRDAAGKLIESFIGEGMMVNSGRFNGMPSSEFKRKVVEHLGGKAKATVNYKMRDWVFSRQRYWGEPIPIVICGKCGEVPLPESELPLLLPEIDNWQPSGTGESPLANLTDWVNTKCPKCGGPAKRETNTMPNWAGSCWYWMRYLDPDNDKAIAASDLIDKWLPVDMYLGGIEHAILHLLYARFWQKFLYDIGVTKHDEPFQRLFAFGMVVKEPDRTPEAIDKVEQVINTHADSMSEQEVKILRRAVAKLRAGANDAEGIFAVLRDAKSIKEPTGQFAQTEELIRGLFKAHKMSKSKSNVVSPDEMVRKYGTDSLRLYEMFMGPPEADKLWTEAGIEGCYRFLKRAWEALYGIGKFADAPAEAVLRETHKMAQKVTERVDGFRFNTAVSAFMEYVNAITVEGEIKGMDRGCCEMFIKCMAPFVPHFAEEIWRTLLGHADSVHAQPWPKFNPELVRENDVEIPIQVNGKLRGRIVVPADASEDTMKEKALADEKVRPHIAGKQVLKVIVARGRLVNIVVG